METGTLIYPYFGPLIPSVARFSYEKSIAAPNIVSEPINSVFKKGQKNLSFFVSDIYDTSSSWRLFYTDSVFLTPLNFIYEILMPKSIP